MWRLYYNKTTGIINHMIELAGQELLEQDRFDTIDFQEKPSLVNVKVNVATKELIPLPPPPGIVFPTRTGITRI